MSSVGGWVPLQGHGVLGKEDTEPWLQQRTFMGSGLARCG